MATFRSFQKGKTRIGLSLSLCIAEMVRENISMNDVDKIMAATCAPNAFVFLSVLCKYTEVYWAEFPWKAVVLAMRMYLAGKIDQPRTRGQKTHTIADGKWAESVADMQAW